MKIRTNFVSNSSSSSFIVGYGVLKPETRNECIKELFENLGEPNCWNGWSTKFASELDDNGKYLGFVQFYVDTYGMEPSDEVLRVEIANNEGDGTVFFTPPEFESNWERAEHKEFYNKEQQRVIEILSDYRYIDKSKPHNWKIGAERNG